MALSGNKEPVRRTPYDGCSEMAALPCLDANDMYGFSESKKQLMRYDCTVSEKSLTRIALRTASLSTQTTRQKKIQSQTIRGKHAHTGPRVVLFLLLAIPFVHGIPRLSVLPQLGIDDAAQRGRFEESCRATESFPIAPSIRLTSLTGQMQLQRKPAKPGKSRSSPKSQRTLCTYWLKKLLGTGNNPVVCALLWRISVQRIHPFRRE